MPTIAAIATPPGQGAISLIRVSGPTVREIGDEVFSGRSKDLTPRLQNFGKIVDSKGETIDEVLLTFFANPQSYTGEDTLEISCHGGILVTQRVLERIFQAGARAALPGEFSQRAFLNGKMDLTQAEAVMDLISAQTDLAMKAAHEQLAGRLGSRLLELRQDLIGVVAHVEAYIDFPDEDIDPESSEEIVSKIRTIRAEVDELVATADQGKILREGVRTVICGAPNVGKSSLLNVLLGFDRAIVSDTAGTTRDTIEEVINLRGIPLRLVDTAGVRESEDAIEREGISRTQAQVENAELVLELVDVSLPQSEWTPVTVPESARYVRVKNKSDLGIDPSWENEDGIAISCETRDGVEGLSDSIFRLLSGSGNVFASTNLIAINARHKHALIEGREFLDAAAGRLSNGESPEFAGLELRAALDSIGEVIGKTDVEEILGAIFSAFCIGK